MKKVLAFIGSPRKNGNTATLVREITRGATVAEADVKIYTLYDMTIKPCRGCFFCQKAENCALKDDDMQSVYEDIKKADAIVIGSPIYAYQVTAQTKLLIDRLFAIIRKDDGYYKPRFGIKNAALVYSYGEANPDNFKQSFEVNGNLFKVMGLNIIDTIISSGANDPQTAIGNDKLMARAFNAGKELVR